MSETNAAVMVMEPKAEPKHMVMEPKAEPKHMVMEPAQIEALSQIVRDYPDLAWQELGPKANADFWGALVGCIDHEISAKGIACYVDVIRFVRQWKATTGHGHTDQGKYAHSLVDRLEEHQLTVLIELLERKTNDNEDDSLGSNQDEDGAKPAATPLSVLDSPATPPQLDLTELLCAASLAEEVLARAGWRDDGTDPEAQALRALRRAMEKARRGELTTDENDDRFRAAIREVRRKILKAFRLADAVHVQLESEEDHLTHEDCEALEEIADKLLDTLREAIELFHIDLDKTDAAVDE